MPPVQRGEAYRLAPGKWGLRYYDADGVRRRKSPFRSKSAALAHYRDVIEPELRGEPAPAPELTLAEFVPLFLERHKAGVRPWTVSVCASGSRTRPPRSATRRCATSSAWPERSRHGVRGRVTRSPARCAG